jgi:hypothetical protein
VFMGLLRNEMDRVNQVLATAGTSGRMTFSAKVRGVGAQHSSHVTSLTTGLECCYQS